MLKHLMCVAVVGTFVAGIAMVIAPASLGMAARVGHLSAGCLECQRHLGVCHDGSVICEQYDGNQAACLAAVQIEGNQNNRAYTCSKQVQTPCCVTKDPQICLQYYGCDYNTQTAACSRQGDDDDDPTYAKNDCDDDPPCW